MTSAAGPFVRSLCTNKLPDLRQRLGGFTPDRLAQLLVVRVAGLEYGVDEVGDAATELEEPYRLVLPVGQVGRVVTEPGTLQRPADTRSHVYSKTPSSVSIAKDAHFHRENAPRAINRLPHRLDVLHLRLVFLNIVLIYSPIFLIS